MKLFKKHASLSAWTIGFLQTAIVILYILAGASIVTSPFLTAAHGVFGSPVFSILAFLSTFVFSALFCGTAVLAYPVLLCFEKQYRRATQVLLWSIAWFALFLLGFWLCVLSIPSSTPSL